jgi:hypothetical protein
MPIREREERGEGWCILRTAGRHTLALAQSLAEDGFEVWTPIETRIVRVPRMNARREVRLALLPTYIFARAEHVVDLLQLAAMPVKPRRGAGLRLPAHASFSLLHGHEGIPLVKDRHLVAMRDLEARRTPRKRAAYAFPRNREVRVREGICGGMVGTVIRSTEAKTSLYFANGRKFEIPTSFLDPEALETDQEPSLRAA